MSMKHKISVDKVSILYHAKIKTKTITKEDGKEETFYGKLNLEYLEDQLNEDCYEITSQWEGTKQGTYKKNYTIKKTEEKEGVIFLGIGFNGNNKQDGKRIKLEFNPNKTHIPNSIYRFFAKNEVKFDKVLRCDIAIDFYNMPMTSFQILPDDGRTILKYIGTRDNLTKYLKPDDSDGHIKIYDKTKERADKGVIINPDTTRIEITVENPLLRNDLEILINNTLSQIVYHFRTDESISWEIVLLSKTDEITRADILHTMADSTRRRYLTKLREISDTINLAVNINEIRATVDSINNYTMEKDLEQIRVTYGKYKESEEQKQKDLFEKIIRFEEIKTAVVNQFNKGLRHLEDEYIIPDPVGFLENWVEENE